MRGFVGVLGLVVVLCFPVISYGQCQNGQCQNGQCNRPLAAWHVLDMPAAPARMNPAIVTVDCQAGNEHEMGTGFIANRANGCAIVVTCAHGYASGKSVVVSTQDSRQFMADVLGVDAVDDVLVLDVRDPGITPLDIADYSPTVGANVHVCSFAGRERTPVDNWGKVTQWLSPLHSSRQTFLDTTCAVVEGCSGGPILNDRGEVVATVTGHGLDHGQWQHTCVGPCLPKVLPTMPIQKFAFQVAYDVGRWSAIQRQEAANGAAIQGLASGQQAEIQQLSGIRDALSRPQVAPPMPPMSAMPSMPSGPDPATIQALQTAQQAQATADAAKKEADATERNVREHGTLLEKINAGGGPLEALHEKIADAHEKIANGDPHLRLILIMCACFAAVLFVVGLIFWITHGHGLIAQALSDAAAQNPSNTGLQQLSQQVTALETGITAKVQAAVGAVTGNPAVGLAGAVTQLQQQLNGVAQQVAATHAVVTATTPAPAAA